jgi:MFS family permease
VLLVAFVATQLRATHPLLPLRVVLNRNRGGSFLTLGLLGVGVFSVFLFLTYYLQQIKGYSPITSGLAYLPLTLTLIAAAGLANTRLLPRTGPRPLMALGMALSAISFGLFAELGVHSSYLTGVLPGLLIAGVGLGLVFAPATDIAIRGVSAADAGVASALVNATNQVGGSLGIALLSTLSATAANHYLASRQPNPNVIAHAAVHGYATAYWWAGAIFIAGAAIAGLLLHRTSEHEIDTDLDLPPVGAL